MKANFSQILPYFSLDIQLKSLHCNSNCSNVLLWSTVIQITQIQSSINTHFWVINWKPHIENFTGPPPCIYAIWPTEMKKLQQLHCYHPFSDFRDTDLTKNPYENYSPKMVPTNPTGSWTISASEEFSGLFSKCFAISTWKLVYTLSRLHNILISCFSRMGSLWPSSCS